MEFLPGDRDRLARDGIPLFKRSYNCSEREILKLEVSGGKIYPYIGIVFDLTSANVSIHQNIRVAAFFFLRTN